MKVDLLKNAEYRYNFDRDIYFNRGTKKAFSLEFVDDADEKELAALIAANSNVNGWTFYFNSGPSESVRRELESVLG